MRTLRYPSELYSGEKMPLWKPAVSHADSLITRALAIGERGMELDSRLSRERVNAEIAKFVVSTARSEYEVEHVTVDGLVVRQKTTHRGVRWTNGNLHSTVETEFERGGQVATTTASAIIADGLVKTDSGILHYQRAGETGYRQYWHHTDSVGELQLAATILASHQLTSHV